MLVRVKAWLADPAVRSALYRFALAVSAFLAAKYAVDGSLMAIVNGALAVAFGIADANVYPPVDPVDVEAAPEYPEAA